MENRKLGAGVAVAGLIVAIVLFIVLSGGDDDNGTSTADSTTEASQTSQDSSQTGSGKPETKPADEEPVIEIKAGAPVGGVQELTFGKGDDIRFEVRSDAAWEIHFHGYDVAQEVPAGGVTKFDVPGDADGVYEVEIEDTATPIAEITVEP